MINVAFRRTPWSEQTEYRQFKPGCSIDEIVRSFDLPVEFATHGGVYLKRAHEDCSEGHVIDRKLWHRIKPKNNAALFVSLVPQGGGGGGEGGKSKNIFQVVAMIALIILTAYIAGPAGIAFFAPVFGPLAGVAASAAAAAVGVAGSAALSLLSKPSAGQQSAVTSGGGGVSGPGAAPGVAGIAQNPISAYSQVPGILGAIRVSPPLLARPYTTIENNDTVLHLICGVCGPCDVASLKINESDIADLPSGVLETEILEGWDDDPELTLVRESVFQENGNLELSKHRLDTDQETLIEPYAGSYPKPHIMRSARNANSFRLTVSFPQGLANYNNSNELAVPFRLRIKNVAGGGWINLPEIHINASRRDPFRQEIWIVWGDDAVEQGLVEEVANESFLFKRAYFQNSEWTSDSYFDAGVVGAVDSNVGHVYRGSDEVFFFLDQDVFAIGQYDVEITRGFADNAAGFNDTTYVAGLFTYRTLAGSVQSIPVQDELVSTCVIENYATFRDEYPIRERGLTLIAITARNLQVNSISAVLSSYVNVWDGTDWDTVAISSNPSALLRHVETGSLNARPIALTRIDNDETSSGSLPFFYDHCVDQSLSCNHVVTEGSVEQACGLVAQCGDAMLRRSDKWGVVIDRDRSDEPVAGMFSPASMTSPLIVTKKFVDGPRGLLPQFRDMTRDYASRDLDRAVFDDGVATTSSTLVESAPYDGLVTEALVRRRAKLDLRRARLRTIKYSWEVSQTHLKNKKGDIVGLAHDILLDTYGSGRVVSSTTSSGDITSVTLNTNMEDLPATGYDNLFDVENVLTLGNLFNLSGPKIGLQIELADGVILTLPISGVTDRTLYVEGSVALPVDGDGRSLVRKTCQATVGLRDRETRRVILAEITPKKDMYAAIDAVDAAPEIFEGLAA